MDNSGVDRGLRCVILYAVDDLCTDILGSLGWCRIPVGCRLPVGDWRFVGKCVTLSQEELEKALYEDYLYRAMMNGEVWIIADEMHKLMTLAYREGYREAIKGIAEG